MKNHPTARRWSLEALVTSMRQHYPTACVTIIEEQQDQVVIQLDHFTITITNQGMIEVTTPTTLHQRVEKLAMEIEQLLSQDQSSMQDQSRS